jgi:hypothetical protein
LPRQPGGLGTCWAACPACLGRVLVFVHDGEFQQAAVLGRKQDDWVQLSFQQAAVLERKQDDSVQLSRFGT